MAGQILDAVDATLEELLLRRVKQLGPGASSAQIGFRPPELNWAQNAGGALALNVYLVDLRENRRLRSNERYPRSVNGSVVDDLAPMRVDRHYLISAWSSDSDLSERTRVEHELLWDVITVLANTPVLTPRSVYPAGGLPTSFPVELADEVLPMTVVPPDGFPKLAEFWGTIPGGTHPWKPVVYLIVTIPVFLEAVEAGAEVTTATTEYRVNGGAGSPDILVRIGGVVLDRKANPIEVGNAWVELSDATGTRLQTARTNAKGEFTFSDIAPGSYHLQARVTGHRVPSDLDITVPSTSGRYDLEFA
jgi:Pvc16 N-terminal domain/Carboxypeptidase regulatory-like domain